MHERPEEHEATSKLHSTYNLNGQLDLLNDTCIESTLIGSESDAGNLENPILICNQITSARRLNSQGICRNPSSVEVVLDGLMRGELSHDMLPTWNH